MAAKKLTIFTLGLVALVFGAMPAFAGAHVLTNEPDVVLTGTKIRAQSNSMRTKFAVGELACDFVEVGGIVTANSGSVVTVSMDGVEEIAEECVRRTPIEEEPVTITPTFKDLHFGTGTESDTLSFTYAVHFSSLKLTCHFDGTVQASVVGGFLVSAGGFLGGTSPAPCPNTGIFSVDFTFLDGVTVLTIDQGSARQLAGGGEAPRAIVPFGTSPKDRIR
jgi:hypothetical protein